MHNVWGFLFNHLPLLPQCEILSIESAYLRAIDLIKASPVLIACKTAELIAFLEGSAERGRTIVPVESFV